MAAKVEYHNCLISRTKPVSKRCILKDCRVIQNLSDGVYVLSPRSDICNCVFDISGSTAGLIAYASGNIESNIIGNTFVFDGDAHTGNFMMKAGSSSGCICNNIAIGANPGAQTWWNKNGDTEEIRGTSVNNTIQNRT